MAQTPMNNNFQFYQVYKGLYYGPEPQAPVRMVATLGTQTRAGSYVPGCLMALLTGGGNAGQVVDYDSAGSNGQNACYAILVDQNVSATAVAGTQALIEKAGGITYIASKLSAKNSGDVTTGMGQLNAIYLNSQFPFATNPAYYVP
jgi:hypothetical protein